MHIIWDQRGKSERQWERQGQRWDQWIRRDEWIGLYCLLGQWKRIYQITVRWDLRDNVFIYMLMMALLQILTLLSMFLLSYARLFPSHFLFYSPPFPFIFFFIFGSVCVSSNCTAENLSSRHQAHLSRQFLLTHVWTHFPISIFLFLFFSPFFSWINRVLNILLYL